jgi:uncharacterized protein YbbC (DUF1343 family)/CubicO group peptidase (beta-lactamase class C family)
MRNPLLACFLPLLVTACAAAEPAKPPAFDSARMAEADRLIDAAIEKGDIPGAVLLVGLGGQTVYRKSYGNRVVLPEKAAMTPDTIFDLASLTKVISTATSIMILADRGKITLTDPVAKHMPEFGQNGKDKITIEDLLLHRGGLIADNALKDYTDGRQRAWTNICDLKTIAPVGTKHIYSDVGFIVLGELVERVEGKRLGHFASESIYEPLGMTSTRYKPPQEWTNRIAPTEKRDGQWIVGVVHDPRAYWLEGVAGHAGLFGNADDLATFCWMILRGGEYMGHRILSERMTKEMVRGRWLPDGTNGRGYGWDIDTAYAGPRGAIYPRGTSFGHTGFTGTSIWLDPASDSFVILLTSRLHPDGKGDTLALRSRIATVTAEAIGLKKELQGVLAGIDVLARDQFKPLDGRKIALITNQTGRDRGGKRTVDLLFEAKNLKLVRLLSPEHGLFGVLDEKVGNSVDENTKLPVLSLYGETRRPTKDMLEGIDTLVFDIQDVGTRFYTYVSTLGYAMEEAAKNHIRVVVLDRPNPITGTRTDGPIADDDRLSFVAYKPLPLVHGMTVGELAMLVNAEHKIGCDLQVVKMEGWKRAMWFDETGLTWTNPSPNMRNATQALLYPAVGMLEYSNISVGRGADQPFEVLGAPWIDGPRLAADLNALKLPGLRFVPVEFKPASSKFKDELCKGVYIIVTDRQVVEPARTGLSIAWQLVRNHNRTFETQHMLKLICDFATYEAMMTASDPAKISETWKKEADEFAEMRKKYLMYE